MFPFSNMFNTLSLELLSFGEEGKFFTTIMFFKKNTGIIVKFWSTFLKYLNYFYVQFYHYNFCIIINAKYTCSIRYNRLAREWTEKYAML